MALLILYNDELYSALKSILKECATQDSLKHDSIPIATFENIMKSGDQAKLFDEKELDYVINAAKQ